LERQDLLPIDMENAALVAAFDEAARPEPDGGPDFAALALCGEDQQLFSRDKRPGAGHDAGRDAPALPLGELTFARDLFHGQLTRVIDAEVQAQCWKPSATIIS
jgi:hypothetical protein